MSPFLTSLLADGVMMTFYFDAAGVYKWIMIRRVRKKELTYSLFNPANPNNQVEVKYDM